MRWLPLLFLLGCTSSPAPETPASTPEAPAAAKSTPASPAPRPTAQIWTNARVVGAKGDVGGLRFDGGAITHVWSGDVPAGLDGERVDLGGAVVIPGLVDAHLHLRGIGRADRQLKLVGTESAAAVAELVQGATDRPAGTWIRGRGWDQNDWAEQAFPTAAVLDAVAPEHPVWLTRVDGHAVWVNSKAMQLAGVTAETADPEGGQVVRGPDGAPTGVFVDAAIDLVYGQLPEPTDAEILGDLRRGIELCQQAGLTGAHDMGVGPRVLAAMQQLEAEGELGLRVTAYLGDGEDLEQRLAGGPDRQGLLQVPGVKLFADGALGSRGAALKAEYSDQPGHSGLLQMTPEQLRAKAALVHGAGFQLAIHAIGDRGVAEAIGAIEQAQGNDRSRRHRIEHIQVLDLADLPRVVQGGIVASMQPTHATSDMPWAEARVGDRIEGAYAWQTLAKAGVPLAFGSDAPVEHHAPRFGLHAAVTRTSPAGDPAGGWRMSEAVDGAQALAGFTAGAAFAGHRPGGRIAVGAPADLTVLDRDPRTADDRIGIEVLRTVVDGRTVYVR
jgi:predicted amidohydrolase YtcJ